MKGEIKYKVGDRVYAPFHGYGVVTEIKDDGREYPITVTWDEKKHGCSASIFTPDGSAFKGLNSEEGHYYDHRSDAEKDITLLEVEGTVEEGKVKTDATNPSHYRVAGIPEAIEIMEHLMTKEQFEGFLWGNIIKYAYRYGRKGDKAETVGKIAWYAKKLEGTMKE